MARKVWIAPAPIALIILIGACRFGLGAPAFAAENGTEILNRTDAVLRQISAIRGLPAKGPVERKLVSKETLRQSLLRRLDEEYPGDLFDAMRQLLVEMRLLRPRDDLREMLIRLATSELAGYYNPMDKTLYLADWIPADYQMPTLVHELTHVLQDQHYDLEGMVFHQPNDSDLASARMGLVEGEATAMMIWVANNGRKVDEVEYEKMIEEQTEKSYRETKVPRFLVESLFFPYRWGHPFVTIGTDRGGWKALDAVFRDPPDSSEQILHPEKYYERRERPVRFDATRIPELLGLSGWRLVHHDVNGEFSLHLWLGQFIADETARKAAEGWGGDVILLLRREGEAEPLLISINRWDTPADAEEFVAAYSKAVPKRFPDAKTKEKTGARRVWRTDRETLFIGRAGASTYFLEGPIDRPAVLGWPRAMEGVK